MGICLSLERERVNRKWEISVKNFNISDGFECFRGRNYYGFRPFCIINEVITTKPVSDALEILVDIVHS